MSERTQPDAPVLSAVASAAAERTVSAISRPWSRVLDANADENTAVLDAVLGSHPLLRPVFLWGVRLFFGLVSRLRVEGLENLPAGGAYVLAVNHECHLDNMFVASVLPRVVQRRVVVISKKEHFDNILTRFFARLCHAVPVDRSYDSTSVLALCTMVLRRGNVLFIHPEGTRSPDGRLLPFKKGVAVLAHEVGCPVVPVRITGAHRFWPKHAALPRRPSLITVVIGRPVAAPANGEPDTDAFTRNLHAAVAALGGDPGNGADAARPR